ncbi:MAG TPA: cell shape determination protein CcmA, partial [Thauera sp.]|nr:cell shape determination protein CcmA [Thauera sp.]
MFNKPNLFHKTAEMPAARSPRPLGGAVSARPVSPEMPATPAAADVAASEAVSAAQGNAVEAVTAVPTERSGESRLIVGPDVKLKGAEILDCDTLVVEGRVEATMDSRVLRIAEAGAYKGTVGIDIAEIHGHFEGELTARVQLLIHSTGRVSGKIRYGKILIEEGGEISGDVQSLVAGAKDGLRAV